MLRCSFRRSLPPDVDHFASGFTNADGNARSEKCSEVCSEVPFLTETALTARHTVMLPTALHPCASGRAGEGHQPE